MKSDGGLQTYSSNFITTSNGSRVSIRPSPAAIARINNEHRFQILVKYKSEPELLKALQYLDDYYHEAYLKNKLALK